MVEIFRAAQFVRGEGIRRALLHFRTAIWHSRQELAVLEPFTRRSPFSILKRGVLVCALLVFCFFYGAAFGLLAPYLMAPFAMVTAIMAALVIWVLPDSRRAPTKTLEFLLFAVVLVIVMWPNYLAIALPGLPWITLSRLTGAPLAITLLICLSVSTSFRSELAVIMRAAPWLRNAVLAFAAVQALSILFSANKAGSIDMFISLQITWTAVFVTGCYVFSRDGLAERMALLLSVMAVGLCGLGIWEFRLGQPPWVGHTPAFLQISDPLIARVLAGGIRASAHRVQGSYTTSLGLAEYFTLAFPFVLYFAIGKHQRLIRAAAIAAAPLLVLLVALTQSRLGIVGLFLTSILYPYALAIPRWMKKSQSLLVGSMIFLSPVLLTAATAATFVVPGIYYRMWGGAAGQQSNEGRIEQLHMGIPKILSHPWGYGIGQGAETLDYHSPGGLLTIDSDWLKVALEYGIIGFLLFLGIFCAALFCSARGVLRIRIADLQNTLFIPIGIALVNFIIIKTAFAGDDNQPIIYLLLGMLAALVFRASAHGETGNGRRGSQRHQRQFALGAQE